MLWNNSTILSMIAKSVSQIFASMIRSQNHNFLAMLILYLILKFFELFKCFILMLH